MAKTVAQLTKEIQRLQKQVDAVKASEVAGVVARIKEAIEHYGLTPEQLFGGRKPGRQKNVTQASLPLLAKGRAAKSKSRTTDRGTKLPAKFSDGKGNSWSGRGSTPRWLADAIAGGRAREDFAVKS
jgi:DNA-binding protein H-NS